VRVLGPADSGRRQVPLLLGALALALCPLAALLIGADPRAPVARARELIAFEQGLGLYVEPAVHAWLRARPGVMEVAGFAYVWAHVPVAGWALVWTWYLRRDRFPVVRDTFLWTQVGVIAATVAVPVAPPWLVPDAGFAATLHDQWGAGFAASAHVLQDPYAAFPSGHVAFALVAGATLARLGDRAWLRAFGWAYPPLVVLVTVATGNHLLVDAGGAAVLVAGAAALARRRVRTRMGATRQAVPARALARGSEVGS